MWRTNPERNEQIYALWEREHTVDQISLETGIPRSTVGYYVRKFNRYAREGRPVVLPQKSERNQDLAWSAVGKLIPFKDIFDMLRNGEVEKVYYLLSIAKLINELKLFPTQEEGKALDKAFGLRS